jgi:hypothetical protein
MSFRPTDHRCGSGRKSVHSVAGQAAERDCAHVGEDLGHLGIAVVLAQVHYRFRIELVEILRVVLSKQDRRGLGRVLCSNDAI